MDPSILEARERVESAETAEMEADRALDQARLRVREAREKENMKRVELEAKEEIRRAQLKQHHAKEVMKRGQGLGRKFIFLLSVKLLCRKMLLTLFCSGHG